MSVGRRAASSLVLFLGGLPRAVCADGAPASPSGPSIFGGKLSNCAPGTTSGQGSCPYGAAALNASQLCVEPVGVRASPFCLDMEKFGHYLMEHPVALGPDGKPAAGTLSAKCEAVPQDMLFSSFANSHFVLQEYLAIALHLCRSCLWVGDLSPGPDEVCWTLALGMTTTTATSTATTLMTASAAWRPEPFEMPSLQISIPMPKLPSLPQLPKVFWPLAITLSVCWFVAWVVFFVFGWRPRDFLGWAAQRPRGNNSRYYSEEAGAEGYIEDVKVDFAGVWEMPLLGQTQVITGSEIRWWDRKLSRIEVTGPMSFQVMQNGRWVQAKLQAGGQQLHWSDGSTWIRAEEGEPLLASEGRGTRRGAAEEDTP
mmetsp:Transcript_40363/g.107676  ORF Transcript_40363/g.107676 Transcript_40363/m.107676 type:complete len:369 (-) Transcript_40363:26-1132(-)